VDEDQLILLPLHCADWNRTAGSDLPGSARGRPGSRVTLWWVRAYRHCAVAKLLSKEGVIDTNALFSASLAGNDAVAVGMLLSTADTSQDRRMINYQLERAIRWATREDNVELMRTLIASPADWRALGDVLMDA
jgi:hypothetical protein